jgi:hypothetical protein
MKCNLDIKTGLIYFEPTLGLVFNDKIRLTNESVINR